MPTDNEPWTVNIFDTFGAWVYVSATLDMERVSGQQFAKAASTVAMAEFGREAIFARWEHGSRVVFRDTDRVAVRSLTARRMEVQIAGETLAEIRARVEVAPAAKPPKRARRAAKVTP